MEGNGLLPRDRRVIRASSSRKDRIGNRTYADHKANLRNQNAVRPASFVREIFAKDLVGQTKLTVTKPRQSTRIRSPHFALRTVANVEYAWPGLPCLVCLGAEKNFNKLAERMEENGEPAVDQNYFKYTVAKAIFWRTAEKLFDTLELDGYRANSIAYGMAWMAEQSERRIDLEQIWNEQKLSPALCDGLKVVTAAAHKHITTQSGNPGEVSKKETCWQEFRARNLTDGAWKAELSGTVFLPANTEEEALSTEWAKVRLRFLNDNRTMGELEAFTGRDWMRTRRSDPIYFYAEKTWEQLRSERLRGNQKLGINSLRGLVKLFSATT